MPTTFAYKVRDRDGRLVTGKVEGENQALVIRKLQDMGFTPISIDQQGGVQLKGDIHIPGLSDRVKLKDLAVFSRQFATMIDSGLTLLRTLSILAAQATNKSFAAKLDTIRQDVERGSSLSEALAKHPKIFSHLFVAMVRSGEVGGNLDHSLISLAENLEKQAELQRKIKSAMAYPVVVLCIVLGICSVMLLFIVPTFAKIFKQLNSKLPKPTRILMAVSRVMVHDMPFVIVGAIIAFLIFRRWKRTPKGRAQFSSIVMRIPIFGQLLIKTALARFTGTLGTLMKSGVPVLQALEITREGINNPALERALDDARDGIKRGDPMSVALQQHTVVPTMVTQMITVGEETGALDDMLHKIETFYEQEVEAMVDALASLLEPLMIVILGGIVGSMIIALYLPMFSIDKVVEDSGNSTK